MTRDEKLMSFIYRVRKARPKIKKLIAGQAYRFLDGLLDSGKLDRATHSELIHEFNVLAYQKVV